MKKISLMLACVTALSLLACSDSSEGENKCEKASAVLKDCPDVEIDAEGANECSESGAAFAQCILDYPDEACEGEGENLEAYQACVNKIQP